MTVSFWSIPKRSCGSANVLGMFKRSAERAVSVSFDEDFAKAERILALDGVRRAMVAYWADALADLRERNAKSVYARYHSYDAVSQLLEYKRARDKVVVGER
ncbi:hypothetical protein [Bradyrhizobium sp. WSM471]|uniref:hypothetical protein n=1 Tax=Bradyrhizobium sp. WSM471 TaxID=319017 RepID=UPI00024D1ED2|nr:MULTISPECIES: hypothetical protein [Bradyrhizobium]EHR01134.1 hypothetical protein Bra471DRAFT_01831 [Bradyrhizobium sp. WSM471]UFW43201.1 hypothetical protein BcanWSM471_09010 [Bradyrhizobium canariense]